MSYLLDKKIRRKKFLYVALSVVLCLILFYFRTSILNTLSLASHAVFRPALVFGNNLGEKLGNVKIFFLSKHSLVEENENLQAQLDANKALMANYNSVLLENFSLKEILGRKREKANLVLSAILGKVNQNLYDTFIIDAGTKENLRAGEIVLAFGNVPVGRIAEVYPDSAKVVLFSNPGEKTEVAITGGNTRLNERAVGQIFLELVGRGGGNFEMVLPRGLTLSKGDQVVLPGINPYVVGVVETIISDPRDSLVKALLVSPINALELKFVEVWISK